MARKKVNVEERKTHLEALCRLQTETREMKSKGFLKADTIYQMFTGRLIDFSNYQRGFVKEKKMIIALMSDIIRGILMLLNPIKFFMYVPDGCEYVTIEKYLGESERYRNKGYKLQVADGSQRIRTIVGVMEDKLEIPKLEGHNEKGEYICEKNILFSELPASAQERIRNTDLFYVCVCSHDEEDFNEIFDKANRLQTNLNVVELMNNKFGKTELWKKALQLLKNNHIITLLGLKNNISHDMQNQNEEMMKSDRGNGVISILKLYWHLCGRYAISGRSVNEMVADMLEDKSGFNTAEKIEADSNRVIELAKICNELNCKIFGASKRSVNRVRSVFAAVALMEKNKHQGEILANKDEINEVVEAIYRFIPSSQDASATASNVNREIAMYVAMFQYICGFYDASMLQNSTIKSALTFDTKNAHIDLYAALEDYYAEKNKASA